MPKASETYNFQRLHPEIGSEWHPTKNGKLTPNELTPGSRRKIWWQCKNGHEWQAAVCNRCRGSGCPHCYKEGIVKGKPILDSNFLAQWHPSLNHGLNPRNLTSTYNRELWWLCHLGHEWQATLRSRIRGDGCPYCVKEDNDAKPSGSDAAARRGRESRISFYRIENNDVHDSYTDTDFRKEKRYPHHAAVMAESPGHDRIIYASMKNFSPSGMYIETDYPIDDGEKIIVHIKEKLTASSPASFTCRVRWCTQLSDHDGKFIGYSVGLQFLS